MTYSKPELSLKPEVYDLGSVSEMVQGITGSGCDWAQLYPPVCEDE